MNVKINSMQTTITKINIDIKINLPTPIIFISFAAPIMFKAFFKLPVCANLASDISWKNEKIKNAINPTEMVRDKETYNGSID